MRRYIRILGLSLALLSAPLVAGAQQVDVEEFTLPNGMKFLLVPRHDQPNTVACGWLARVGSANERPGITGVSHLFEHLMFKGTSTIGTRDAAADRAIIDKLADLRTQLLDLQTTVQFKRWKQGEIESPWDAANDTPEMATIREKMRQLQEQQHDVVVKDEFDQVYTSLGGSGMNAFTNNDVTFYFISVPSNKVELWAWMESDRLGDSVFREFYAERDVVHEERRLRTESTPTGKFNEQFDSMFWMASPYNWPVVGWPSDLNALTREQAEAYFNIYYRPNNLVGVLVGDFETADVKPMIQQYFSRLEPGPTPPPVVTQEIKQQAEMRMYAECDCQPQVEVRYHAVPFNHHDVYPLDLLSEILNGRTGRLRKTLIEDKGIASSAFARIDPRKYAGSFSVSIEAKSDADPEQLENAWYGILKDIQDNGVGEHELQKVKNQAAADSYRRLQSNFFLLLQLGVSEALGDWREINDGPRKTQEVTAADIQRVAKQYFDKTNRAVAVFHRSADAQPEDPELLALDPQIRAGVKRQVQALAMVTDAGQLEQALGQLEAQMAQAPPQFKSAMEYMAKKVRERIKELKEGGDQ